MQKRGDCTAETMDNPTKITGAKGELLRSFLHRLRRGDMLKYYHTVSVVFDTGEHYDVLSESFLHLLLWPIFRQSHSNFRGGRNANASEIWAQLTKNLLTKSSTERFRENILVKEGENECFYWKWPHYCWE